MKFPRFSVTPALAIFIVLLFSHKTFSYVAEGYEGLGLQNAHVFDQDDRTVEERTIFNTRPYNMIVKIGLNCTGALVGEDLVLTNHHCLFGAFKVRAFFHKGKSQFQAKIIDRIFEGSEVKGNRKTPENDWALLKIDKPLGRTLGYFGVYETMPDIRGLDVNLSGYSSDKFFGLVLSTHRGCSIRELEANRFRHDCDMMKGASGSPIWTKEGDNYYIVGLNSAQFMPKITLPEGAKSKGSGYFGVPYQRNLANVGVRPETYAPTLLKERAKGFSESI